MQNCITLSVLFLLSSGMTLHATQAPTASDKAIDYIPEFYQVIEQYRGGQRSATDVLRGVAIFQFSEHEKNINEYVHEQGIDIKKLAQNTREDAYKNFKDKVAAKTAQRKDAADLIAAMRLLDKNERARVVFQLQEDGLLSDYEKWYVEWNDDWKKKMKEYDARLKTKPAETKRTQEKVSKNDIDKILDEIEKKRVDAAIANKPFSLLTEEKSKIRAWYQNFGAQTKDFESSLTQRGLWDLISPVIKDIKPTVAASTSSATASRTASSSSAASASTATTSSASSVSSAAAPKKIAASAVGSQQQISKELDAYNKAYKNYEEALKQFDRAVYIASYREWVDAFNNLSYEEQQNAIIVLKEKDHYKDLAAWAQHTVGKKMQLKKQ